MSFITFGLLVACDFFQSQAVRSRGILPTHCVLIILDGGPAVNQVSSLIFPLQVRLSFFFLCLGAVSLSWIATSQQDTSERSRSGTRKLQVWNFEFFFSRGLKRFFWNIFCRTTLFFSVCLNRLLWIFCFCFARQLNSAPNGNIKWVLFNLGDQLHVLPYLWISMFWPCQVTHIFLQMYPVRDSKSV